MSQEELAATAAEEQEQTTEEAVNTEPCARCGFTVAKEPMPLEKDMEEYLRCILGGQSFSKQYKLYDGKIKLTFRGLNNREIDKLNDLLFKMTDHMDHQEVQDRSIKLKLLFFLSAVQLDDRDAEYAVPDLKEFEDIGEEFNKRFGDCSEGVIRLMSQNLFIFMDLQGLLVAQGFDANFWEGAGLRSR